MYEQCSKHVLMDDYGGIYTTYSCIGHYHNPLWESYEATSRKERHRVLNSADIGLS